MATYTKNSRQKQAILHALRSVTSHPTADWIYARVREELPNISLGTVYRNLSRFAQEGVILRLDVGTGTDRFDGTPYPHYHFMCRECGAVSDLALPYDAGLDQRAHEVSGAEVDSHTLVFHGTCKACKMAKDDGESPSF